MVMSPPGSFPEGSRGVKLGLSALFIVAGAVMAVAGVVGLIT